MHTLVNKFTQILLMTAMRFYARKIVYNVDNQIKHLSNYNKLSITCTTCEHKHSFVDHTLLYNADNFICSNCRYCFT